MEKAISLDPGNYRAHLSLGTWHAEIVAAAGFMANLLYGANEDDSILSYQMGISNQPELFSNMQLIFHHHPLHPHLFET